MSNLLCRCHNDSLAKNIVCSRCNKEWIEKMNSAERILNCQKHNNGNQLLSYQQLCYDCTSKGYHIMSNGNIDLILS